MHLATTRILALGAALLIAAPALAQQTAPAASPPTPSQADPRALAQPKSQPIVPPAQQPGAQQQGQAPQAEQPPKEEPAKKPPPKKESPTRGTTRSMAFDVPPLVPISEIPRGKAVTIQGVVLSPQATTFVLNDGNSSQVIVIGPTWRDLTKVKSGDRVRVIGQLDPYGTSVFRAGSILLENNRIVVVPAS